MTVLKTHCISALKSQLTIAEFMNTLAWYAFVAGLLIIGLQAIIELFKLLKVPAPPPKTDNLASASANLSSLVTALPKLIDALAKAPASIILIGVAFMLVAFSDTSPSESCKVILVATEQNQAS